MTKGKKKAKDQRKRDKLRYVLPTQRLIIFSFLVTSEMAVDMYEIEGCNSREERIENKSKGRQNKLKTDKQQGEILENTF